MAQLKMVRLQGEVNEKYLPDDYSFQYFNGTEEEINDWLNICINGLIPDTNEKWFDECITNYPDLDPVNDLFFVVDDTGKRVATSCSVTRKNGEGYIHMVAVLPSCRGKGIGQAMLCFSLRELFKRGCESITLTTDDFRLPAIKTYLDAGFKPVIYDDGETNMQERWDKVVSQLGYVSVSYINE